MLKVTKGFPMFKTFLASVLALFAAAAFAVDVNKACNDSLPCTVNDVCQSDGVCRGTQRSCDDGNVVLARERAPSAHIPAVHVR